MTSTGTVHLIHGYLCCGKTTFARELERETGGVRISLDEWATRIAGDAVHLDDELYARLYGVAMDLWPSIAASGADVILDFGFWARTRRDDVRALATGLGVPHRLYWIRCPDETARARCRHRNESPAASYVIDDGAYDALRQKFEPLGADEAHELVETG